MIRQIKYEEIADTFGTDIGVAEWSEPLYGYHSNVAKIPDDLKVAILTQWIIRKGIYQQVIREVLRLEQKWKNKKIKQSTLYEKAMDIIIEKYQIPIE